MMVGIWRMLTSTSSKLNCCSRTYRKGNMKHQGCQLRLGHTFSSILNSYAICRFRVPVEKDYPLMIFYRGFAPILKRLTHGYPFCGFRLKFELQQQRQWFQLDMLVDTYTLFSFPLYFKFNCSFHWQHILAAYGGVNWWVISIVLDILLGLPLSQFLHQQELVYSMPYMHHLPFAIYLDVNGTKMPGKLCY